MTTKHTPGPWTWDDAPGRGLQIYGNPGPMKGGPWYPTGGGPVIIWGLVESPAPITLGYERWVQFEPEGWAEMQRANARLISAAPDMLDACRQLDEFQRTYDANTHGDQMPGNEHYSGLLMAIVVSVRAALAKATGAR